MTTAHPSNYWPVGHGLNEHWSLFFHRLLPGILGHLVHGQHVVPIHTYCLHPIARASRCYPISRVVLRHRRRYGITVVAAAANRGTRLNTDWVTQTLSHTNTVEPHRGTRLNTESRKHWVTQTLTLSHTNTESHRASLCTRAVQPLQEHSGTNVASEKMQRNMSYTMIELQLSSVYSSYILYMPTKLHFSKLLSHLQRPPQVSTTPYTFL